MFFAKSAQTTEKTADELPRAAKECGKNARKTARSMRGRVELVPHPPGNSDDYQKKGVAKRAIWMNVKRKELGKAGQTGGSRRPFAAARGKEKWGRKFRMGAS